MSTATKTKPQATVSHHGIQQATLWQLFAAFDFENMIPTHNPGRDDRESWGLPELQIPTEMYSGFDPSKGCLVAHPIEAFGQKAVATALRQRKQRIKLLKDAGDAVFTYSFSAEGENDSKHDRKVEISCQTVAELLESNVNVEPLYWVVCGQRRTYAAVFTLALAAIEKGKEFADNYRFLVDVRSFVNMNSTRKMQLEENCENARQGYSEVGLLRNAISTLQDFPGMGVTDLGRLLGLEDIKDAGGNTTKSNYGARQKNHRWALLSTQHDSLCIYDRLNVEPVELKSGPRKGKLKYIADSGHLPVKKLDKENAQSLLGQAKKPNGMIKELLNMEEGEEPRRATTKEMETHFAQVINGSKTAGSASLGKAALENMLNTPAIADKQARIGDVLKAIINGDNSFFKA